MSVSFDQAGSIKFKSSGTGANSFSASLVCPTSMAADRNITIPDPGAAANLLLSAGAQTISGAQTFSASMNTTGIVNTGTVSSTGAVTISPATNQLVLGAAGHLVTINSVAPAAAAQTMTIYDPAQSCNVQLGVRQIIQLVAGGGAQTALTAANSGALILVPILAANSTITVPDAAAALAGVWYEFFVQGTLSHTLIVTPVSGGNHFDGILLTSAGAAASSNVATTGLNASLTFTATGILGDNVRLFCDGVSWHANGMSHAAAGLSMP